MNDEIGPGSPNCLRYAQFASHLVRWQFKVIYWVLFISNLLLLFCGSFAYIKAQEALSNYTEHPRKLQKRLRLCIFVCTGCVFASTIMVVMEAYALLALQFCDGEDLMSLYWSTWTMIQVGSLIAIVGVILAMIHSLRNKQHPPWALAMGTPVLVIAGLLHMCFYSSKARLQRWFGKPGPETTTTDKDTEAGPSMSRVNTLGPSSGESVDDTIIGHFVGFTVDGGPIVRFNNSEAIDLSAGGELLGRFDNNSVLVAYQRGTLRFLTDEWDGCETPTGQAQAEKSR